MAHAALETPIERLKHSSSYEKHRKSSGKFNPKFLFAGLVIVAAAVFIAYSAMQGAAVYYYDLHEVQTKISNNTLPSEPFRLAGQVIPGTIVSQEGSVYTFEIRDMKFKEFSGTMKVSYKGVAPDTFKDEAQVTLTGTFDKTKKTFVATNMLAKCPSKYSTTATES